MPVTSAASAIKAGTVAHFAANSAPAGWLKANGAAISRSAYAGLFAAIGTTYGGGDGSTTFNLPDLRGEFVRSLDDGRGADPGRGMGTNQAFATQAQSGELQAGRWGDFGTFKGNSGIFTSLGNWFGNRMQGSGGEGGYYSAFLNIGTPGASETRPRNVAMLACIKY